MIFLYTAIIPNEENYESVFFTIGSPITILTPLTAAIFCNDMNISQDLNLTHMESGGNWFILDDINNDPIQIK